MNTIKGRTAAKYTGPVIGATCTAVAVTGIVVLRHGRHFIGVELDPEYADLSRARIAEEMDKMDVKIDIGTLFDCEDDR